MPESKLRIVEKVNKIVLIYSSLGSACEQKVLGLEGDLLHQKQLQKLNFPSCKEGL